MLGYYGGGANESFPVNSAELYPLAGLHDGILGMTGESPGHFSALQAQGAHAGDIMSAPLEYWPFISQDECEALQASLEALLGNATFVDHSAFAGADADFCDSAFPGFFTPCSTEQRDDGCNGGTEHVSNTSFLNSSLGNPTNTGVNSQRERAFDLINEGFLTTAPSAQMPALNPTSVWNVPFESALDRCMPLEMDLNAQVACHPGVVNLTYIGQDPGVAVEDKKGWDLDTGVTFERWRFE